MDNRMHMNSAARFAIPAMAAALAMMLCLMIGAGTAWAGGVKPIGDFHGKVTTVYLNKGDTEAYGDTQTGKKITAAKSSNKKVATVKVKNYGSNDVLLITKKKAGTTKITYKLAGKQKTATLKIVKWQNPVKTFKIGSKNYASAFKSAASIDAADKLGGKTVKVKAASGWKVKKISVFTNDGKTKTVKSGKKLPKSTCMVSVQLKNKKTKIVEDVLVRYF